ncbi:MAG: hypothetical protein JWP47_2506 [Polaromonas sp.]|nr:hypothetical protein [Polaromonas sp.]
MPDDLLADELRKRVVAAPVLFDVNPQFADRSDQLVGLTKVWPDSHQGGVGR